MLKYQTSNPKRIRRQALYFKCLIKVYQLNLFLLQNLKWLLNGWQLEDEFLEANIDSDKDIIGLLKKDMQSTKQILDNNSNS